MSYQNSRRYSTSSEMQLARAQVNLGNGEWTEAGEWVESTPDQLAYQKGLLDYQSRGLSSGGWYTGPLPYRFKVVGKTTVFAEPAQSQAMGELYAGPEWFYGTEMVPDPSQPGDTQFIQLLDTNWVEFGGNLQVWKNTNGNGVTCPPGQVPDEYGGCRSVPQCQPNEVLQKGGPGDSDYVCVCKGGAERVDGYCFTKCKPNEVRDSNRNCVPDDKGKGTGKDKGTGKGEGTEKPSAIPPELFLAAGAFLVLQGLLGGN